MRIKWLLIVFPVWTGISIITTYTIAVSKGHMVPLLPTISETGRYWPESRIFAVGMNISAGLGLLIVVMRYLQFKNTYCEYPMKIKMINCFGLLIGCIALLCQILIANYKNLDEEFIVHETATDIMFVCSYVYGAVQSYLTYVVMSSKLSLVRMFYIRMCCTTSLLLFGIIAAVLNYFMRKDMVDDYPTHILVDVPAYNMNIALNAMEWLTVMVIIIVISSFYAELKNIEVCLNMVVGNGEEESEVLLKSMEWKICSLE